MKQKIGQQGEVCIIKIDALPEGMSTIPARRVDAGFVVAHSESGHHHCVTGGDVIERTNDVPEGMKIFYAILDEPEKLVQDASHAHGEFDLSPGIFEFRVSREYDPFSEQARIVAD
jgi:hypothetical protein